MTSLMRRALALTFAIALSAGLTAGVTVAPAEARDISWKTPNP